MSRIAIFIDGAYLDYTLRGEFAAARIDYQQFAAWISGGLDLLRTYYYHCLPYKSNPPTIGESQRFSQAQGFHRRLQCLPRFHPANTSMIHGHLDNVDTSRMTERLT